MIRVLHTLDTFMNISENWIYPQITQVPGTWTRAFCNTVKNRESFPISNSRLIFDPPPWNYGLGIPRLLNSATWRLGKPGAFTTFRIRCGRPQILHAHFGTRGWQSLALKRRLNVPLATSFYGYDAWQLPITEPVWRERYRELFAEGEAFLVEGPAMRSRLVGLGCPKEKVVIQRIGVDLTPLISETKIFSKGLKIAMVGRFIEKKGLADGLSACALAVSRGANLSVSVIGDAYPTDAAGQQIKEDLRRLANQPALSGRVVFTGLLPLAQTRATLKEHNVFLCPSKHAANGDAEGGSPVSLTEAMALGLLCIGTRHCDIPEVIADGKTGYLSNEGDTEAIASILCSISARNGETVEVVQAGRRHIEDLFNLQRQLGKMSVAYKSLLNMRQS